MHSGVLRAQERVEPVRLQLKAPHGTVAWLMEVRSVLRHSGRVPSRMQRAATGSARKHWHARLTEPREIEVAEVNDDVDSDGSPSS